MNALQQFFYMHGYGYYVFSAYGSVLFLLFLLWIFPWRRWRHYKQEQTKIENN